MSNTPEDTDPAPRRTIAIAVAMADVDLVMNLIALRTIEAYKKGYIDGGIQEITK